MEPMTRGEIYMAAAAGEYDGDLPTAVTRPERYWTKIIERIDSGGGGSVSPEQIDAAIAAYLNTHDADIVTEQELSDGLSGYYNKTDIDAALSGKQNVLTAGENISITDNNGDLIIYATDTTYSAATTSAAGLMSPADKTKLDGIETGAQTNTVTGVKGSNEAEYRVGNVSITKGNVGLGNVDNTADADKPISTAAQTALDDKVDKITGKGLSEANFTNTEKTKLAGIEAGAEANVQSDWNQGDDAADDYIKNKPVNLVQDASYVHTDNNFTNAEKAKADGAIQSTEKGTANGVAELDANGKVPTSQLPAYVDDVLSYNSLNDFPATGEDGKIYIAKDTNLSYRWGSSEYVVISPSLALGSTSSTAYRGDWGAEDRAAIGTLSTLNTTEKSNLVGAINELKTASDAKQGTLTFDSAPTSGSTNPVTSGGVYTALAGKQGTLTFDSSPTENSDNLVKSGVIYTALAGKADAAATQTALAGKADAAATQTALAGKQNALTAGANITIETVNDALTISATDTWVPNSSGAAGYVASAQGQANKAWMTDGNGNPAWRDVSAPTDAQVRTAVYSYLDNEDIEEMVQTIGGAMTADIKQALLDALAHVAWADASGMTYYNTLEAALFPPLNLISISAVYTPTKSIYVGDSLDELRSDLVVTANYSDNTTETITAYTLTGTLIAGTRTITVTYRGKTATFQVTVVVSEELWINHLGSTARISNSTYAPFVLPTSTYQYDYSKPIRAIELDFDSAGTLSVGYCKQGTPSGTYRASDVVVCETFSVSTTGVHKLSLQTPLTIPQNGALLIGVQNDSAKFYYGGTLTNGFIYHHSDGIWAPQSLTLGINVYR